MFVWCPVVAAGGGGVSEAISNATPERVARTWAAGSVFWIPTMMSIYRWVPLSHKVLATACANVVWGTYLALRCL